MPENEVDLVILWKNDLYLYFMFKSLRDQEQNFGLWGHWTKGANVTQGGHQIEKFILKKIKKEKRTE